MLLPILDPNILLGILFYTSLVDIYVEKTIILKQLWDYELGFSGLGYDLAAGPCEHGNEHSSSIKGGEGISWLSEWLLASQRLFFMELVSLNMKELYFNH
jgi:hypothetical protein